MIEFWLEGRAVGKARPRFGRNGSVHTCCRYRQWKSDALLQLMSLKLPPAPRPAAINCLFVNFASSDSDNLTGSVLDALVESGVLENDSSSHIVSSSGTFAKTQKIRGQDKPVGILVQILPAEIKILDLSDRAIA